MPQSIATITVSEITKKSNVEVEFNRCGLIFTNQSTGQNEGWSQGGTALYSFHIGKMFFVRDNQVWTADNSSVDKEAFKKTYKKLMKMADDTHAALGLERKTLIQMHNKAHVKALSLSLRVKL